MAPPQKKSAAARAAAKSLPRWVREGGRSASSRPTCTRSQRAPGQAVGCALTHAVIEGLRLGVGRDAEEARQQLAAASVGLQRLAVIPELLVAEHKAPIQARVERAA